MRPLAMVEVGNSQIRSGSQMPVMAEVIAVSYLLGIAVDVLRAMPEPMPRQLVTGDSVKSLAMAHMVHSGNAVPVVVGEMHVRHMLVMRRVG